MTSMTIKKFIELLDKEETLALLNKLKLSDKGATSLILRRINWVWYCLETIDKNKIKNNSLIRFIDDSKELLNKFNSIESIDIIKLIKKLNSLSLNIDGLIDMSTVNYKLGTMLLRVISSYKLLLVRVHDDNFRNMRI